MRQDILEEKRKMELRRDKWLKNPEGFPPPDPYIIDWEYKSMIRDSEELWVKSWRMIGILLPIMIILMFICILI